jgi:Spy/CpxP family protein refolding chaperone
MTTRWQRVGIGLIALSLVGAMTAYGWADFGHRGHRFRSGGAGFPFQVLKGLDLTAEQQTQIQTIKNAHQETFMALGKELHAINDEVTNKFLASGDVTTENFTSQTERIATLEAQLFKERLAVGLEVRKILTPDQLTQAAELIAKRRALRAERESSLQTQQ